MSRHTAALFHQLRRLTGPTPGDAELLRRWVERRDEDAFTALVARHGRMVHGTCRRVLGNTHDAEDAFQAVFLILARKAATLRHPEALAGWLHGVGVRLAYKARTAAARRPSSDPGSSVVEPRDPHPDPLDVLSARELLALIDREIARLPEVYRLPLVLCDLEERTQAEAALVLGWSLGSLRGRLLRGRARLRTRLARRGIAPAVLSAAFLQGTTNAVDVGRLPVVVSISEVSPSVTALVRAGVRGMMLTKLKLVSAVLLVASTLAAGAGVLAWPTPASSPAEERAEKKSVPAPVSVKPLVRRDQAGDPLPAEALSRLGTTRFRHGGLIDYVAFTPDGKTLVSHGGDGIRLWDAVSGAEVRRFPESAAARSIALSPDGNWLAMRVNSDKPTDAPIVLHEFTTGRLLRRFGEGQQTAPRILFSPDGKMLAAFSWKHDIELWDPANGHRLHTLKGHKDIVWSIAFSTDGKMLVSSSDDKTIRFWDVATGKQLRQIAHNQGVGKIVLSPDGKFLASVDTIKQTHQRATLWLYDHRVRLWDTASGKELRQLIIPKKESAPKFAGSILSLGFAPNSQLLLTGSLDGMLRIWEAATGKEVRQIPGFTGSPGVFTFAPDGKSLAVVDGSSTLRVLDFTSGKDNALSRGHRCSVFSIGMTQDGQTIATTGQDRTLRFWEAATGRETRRRVVTRDYLSPPRIQPDGQTYLTVGDDRMFRVHDLVSGEQLAVLRGHDSSYHFALSPDRQTLASVNADKAVRLLDPATGAVRHTLFSVKEGVSGMCFTPDARKLVVWDDDRTVTVWDVATGKKVRQFLGPKEEGSQPDGHPLPYTAALSPDGKLLAFGLQNMVYRKPGILPVMNTTTGREVCRFLAAEDGVSRMAFSPDGKNLAWGGWSDGTVYLGEIATGKERRRFVGHTGRIISLAFAADGQTLISGAEDTTALVWDLTGRLTMGKKFGQALSAEELEEQWNTLAAADAAAGYRAVQTLAADPERSVPYLRTRLQSVAVADENRLKQWIADLDSDQFAVREKAASELEKLGASALHALRKARDNRPALETRRRLEQLIEKQEREEWSPSTDRLRTVRALEVLERAATPEAKRVLTILANGAPGAWLTLDAKSTLVRQGEACPCSRRPFRPR